MAFNMKKFIISSIFLLAYVSNIHAQDVRYGFKGGVNLSNVASDDLDHETLTSFHIGAVLEALFNEKIALQPEILYSKQGFKTSDFSEELTYKLAYITIPVMVKYYVTEGLIVEAGPQMGFLHTAKIISESDGNSDAEDIKEGLRSNDFCFNFGLGYQLENGWSLGARYNWGISNIVREQLNQNFKNRVVQLSIGYLF